MKMTCIYSRFLNWVGLTFVALATPYIAPAQLTPMWTVNHGQAVLPGSVLGTYYNTPNLTGIVFGRNTATIDFDWGFGSPAPGFPADQFSVLWTGTIAPKVSESYTFFATSDDGVRIWLNDQLILDRWLVQGATEWASNPIHLTAGSLYKLRVEYFESTGAALIRVHWSSVNLPKQLVTFQNSPDGSEANFGAVLGGFGDGRFAVGAPLAEVLLDIFQNNYIQNGGGLVLRPVRAKPRVSIRSDKHPSP